MQRGSEGEAQDRTKERGPGKEERRFCPIVCWWLGREGPGFTYMAVKVTQCSVFRGLLDTRAGRRLAGLLGAPA